MALNEPSHSSRGQKAPVHVHLENPPPFFNGILDGQSTSRDAGETQQDIDALELPGYFFDSFVYLRLIRDVDLSKQDRRACLCADATIMLYGEGALSLVYVKDGEMR